MLKQKVLDIIIQKKMYATVASRLGVSESTARRWINSNDPMLTTHDALIALSDLLEMKVDSMLTKRVQA